MSNETKLRYRNKELTNALVQADGLLQQMSWRIERGESMATAFAFEVVQTLQELGLPEVAELIQSRYEKSVKEAIESAQETK